MKKPELIDKIEDVIIHLMDTARVNATFKTTTRSKDDDDKEIQILGEIVEELRKQNV